MHAKNLFNIIVKKVASVNYKRSVFFFFFGGCVNWLKETDVLIQNRVLFGCLCILCIAFQHASEAQISSASFILLVN